MILCSACKRHLKGDVDECVFCGARALAEAPAPSRLPVRFGLVALGAIAVAAASACGPKPVMSMYGGPPTLDVPDAGPIPDEAGSPTPIVGRN